jgi:hypothetical protein
VRRACLHSEEMCVHCGSWNERWPAITMSTTSSSVLPLNGHAPASIVYTDTPIDHMSHWPENTARSDTAYHVPTRTTCCNTVQHVATRRPHRPADRPCVPLLRVHKPRTSHLRKAGISRVPSHAVPVRLFRILRSGAGNEEEGNGRAWEAHCFGIRALENLGRHIVH